MKKLLVTEFIRAMITFVVYLLIAFVLLEGDVTEWGYFPRILLVVSFLLSFRLEDVVDKIKRDNES